MRKWYVTATACLAGLWLLAGVAQAEEWNGKSETRTVTGFQVELTTPAEGVKVGENNLADLQTRIANWQKGDEGSMGIAKEKAERIEILIPHLYSTGVVVKDLPPIQTALPAIFAAIERKDAEGTALAAKPIAAAADAAAEGPNWPVIAGFAAVMALVIFGAALTKPRAAPSRSGWLSGGV